MLTFHRELLRFRTLAEAARGEALQWVKCRGVAKWFLFAGGRYIGHLRGRRPRGFNVPVRSDRGAAVKFDVLELGNGWREVAHDRNGYPLYQSRPV